MSCLSFGPEAFVRVPVIRHSSRPLFKTGIVFTLCMATSPSWAEPTSMDVSRESTRDSLPAHVQHEYPHSRLDPIVVTAVAPTSPLTVVTDPKQPRQPAPASDGADYLSTIPGFSMIRNGGTNGDSVFRGMFGSRLKMLTNGAEMLGACPARMDAPTSYISPESYDRLTIVKGPESVLWGPGASAGTVHFDRGPEKFDTPGTRIDGGLMLGTYGRLDRQIDAAVGNKEGYIRVEGTKSEANDYKDGVGRNVPSSWDKWSGDVSLGWMPDADTWFEISAGRGNGEARYAGRGMDGAKFWRETAAIRFEKKNMTEHWRKLEMQANYAYADHIMDNFTLRHPTSMHMGHDMGSMEGVGGMSGMGGMAMSGDKMAMELDRRTRSARMASTWEWDRVDWIAGIDANHQDHRGRNSFYDMQGRYHGPGSAPWEKDYSYTQYGLFSELTWYATDDSRVISGARLDHYHVADRTSDNTTSGDTRNTTLPSGFLRFEQDLASSTATWYVGVGHVERFPDYWETRPGLAGASHGQGAFSAIKPEKTTQLDAGIQYEGERTKAWVSAYAGYVNDFIMFDYGRGNNPYATNIDATIAGGELGGSYAITSHWKTEATLAYAWGRDVTNHEPLPQIPPLETRLGLTYERGNYSVGGLWRLVAAQHRTALNKGNVVGQDLDSSSGFSVFSLNGSYRINNHFSFSTGIDNLFDKAYTEHLNLAGNSAFGFPADTAFRNPGRMYWAKLNFHF